MKTTLGSKSKMNPIYTDLILAGFVFILALFLLIAY